MKGDKTKKTGTSKPESKGDSAKKTEKCICEICMCG